jgi:N-acylneuraminate cytidylyltransferase
MTPVLRHALTEAERQDGREYASVLLLDPTSPGRTPEDIAAAVRALEEDDECDGVIAVSEPEFNPYWHCVIEDDGYMRDLLPGAASFSRRQDLPTVYRINGSLYLWRRRLIMSDRHWRSGRTRMHVIPEERAIHIDDVAQFEHASLLLEHGLLTFPWLVPMSSTESRAHA